MEELLRQINVSPTLSETEMQTTLEKMEVDLSRKISVMTDRGKKQELEKQLNLVGDALIMLQDKRKEEKKKEQEAQEKREKEARRESEQKERKKRLESGLQAYREETPYRQEREHKEEPEPNRISALKNEKSAPDFSVDKIYTEYEKAVTGKDFETQRRLFAEVSREAEIGNSRAINLLGLLYYLENGGEHTVKSARLLLEAAEKNSASAFFNLSTMSRKGVVVEQSSAKAKKYLEQSAELGYESAWLRLAEYYENGNSEYDVTKDWKKAGAYYKKLLDGQEKDSANIQFRMFLYKYAKCSYSVDRSITDRGDKMSDLLQPLLQKEGKYTQESRMLLGEVYVQEEEYIKAVDHYLKAGGDGVKGIMKMFCDMPADEKRDKLDIMLENMAVEEYKYTRSLRGEIYNWYGERYRNGMAKEKNDVKAWKYYLEAIGLGYKEAAKNRDLLVEGYLEGDGFEALAFFKNAADKGVMDANRYLGDIYAAGRGCEIDYAKAGECYLYGKRGTMAAYCEKKIPEMSRFEKCKAVFENVSAAFYTENYEMAIAKLEQLADVDYYPAAQYFMAELNEHGNMHYYFGRKDPAKAFRYYRSAAEKGFRKAQRKMVEIYSKGLLGIRADNRMAAHWEQRLRK